MSNPKQIKIVVAPDSFKGSLSASDTAAAIARGIRHAWPNADVRELPLADGGEGTAEAFVRACGGEMVRAEAHGPLGEPLQAASYAILADGSAVIDTAEASGLALVARDKLDPLRADSAGTGELIRDALDRGCRQFRIGLGGTATNDGGAGILRALGWRFLDADGQALEPGGGALERLAAIDGSGADPRLADCRFTLLSDVVNPLCGPTGASCVFGPQKGAMPEAVERLDAALLVYGRLLEAQTGRSVIEMRGAGAAGGIGAGLSALLPHVSIESGIDALMEAANLTEALQSAKLVITGEGRLDSQTLSGKAIAGICRASAAAGVPVIALCGSMELSVDQLDEIGLTAAYTIVRGPVPLETAERHAAEWTERTAANVFRLLAACDKL